MCDVLSEERIVELKKEFERLCCDMPEFSKIQNENGEYVEIGTQAAWEGFKSTEIWKLTSETYRNPPKRIFIPPKPWRFYPPAFIDWEENIKIGDKLPRGKFFARQEILRKKFGY